MINKEISISQDFDTFTSRESGEIGKQILIDFLKKYEKITFNMENKSLTPSFIDSALGGVIEEIGLDQFKKSFKFINVKPSTKMLMKVVIRNKQKQDFFLMIWIFKKI